MTSRLAAEGIGGGGSEMGTGVLPEQLHDSFSTAMAQSMWLPAAVLIVGFAASLFFARPPSQVQRGVDTDPDTADARRG